MDRYQAPGSVKGGVLDVNRDRLKAALAGMGDGPIVLTVERKKAKRSLAQNAFLWGVCYDLLSEHTGFTPDEVHELMKGIHLPKKKTLCDGNGELIGEFVIGGSTTVLSTQEMGDYIAAVRAWSLGKLNVRIPEPNEPW